MLNVAFLHVLYTKEAKTSFISIPVPVSVRRVYVFIWLYGLSYLVCFQWENGSNYFYVTNFTFPYMPESHVGFLELSYLV